MSDTKLRELERRWNETGAVEDEAAYLLERVRVGDLTQERLELAAYCGHEGARRGGQRHFSEPPSTPIEFVRSLAVWGHEACVRAAVAAVATLLDDFESWNSDSRPRRALETLTEWLNCPCEEHEAAVNEAQVQSWTAFQEAQRYPLVARAASMLAGVPKIVAGNPEPHPTYPALQAVSFLLRGVANSTQITRSMRRALLDWIGLPTAVV